MVSTENKILGLVVGLLLIAAVVLYFLEYFSEMPTPTLATTKSSTQATTLPTSTSKITTTLESTLASTTEATSMLTTTTEASTTTVLVTSTTRPDYLAQYRGKGYNQAYINVVFQCPSCVPAIAATLRAQPGLIAKSMSYRQRLSWVIYDPERADLDRIVQIFGSSAESQLINVTEI